MTIFGNKYFIETMKSDFQHSFNNDIIDRKYSIYNQRENFFLLLHNVFIIYSNKSMWLVFQMSNTFFEFINCNQFTQVKCINIYVTWNTFLEKNITIPILWSIINKVLQFCYSKRALISAAIQWINVHILKLTPWNVVSGWLFK